MASPSKRPSRPLQGRRRLLGALVALPTLLTGCSPKAGSQPPAGSLVGPLVGQLLPVIELPDLNGRPIRLGEARQALLLNFWASWCPPCRAEMGSLDHLYQIWGAAGLGVYGISIDDDINLVREFVLQNHITFPILADRAGALTQGQLALRNFPTTLLVGSDARVVEVVVGARAWDAAPAQESVRALLAR